MSDGKKSKNTEDIATTLYGSHRFGPPECPPGTDGIFSHCACGASEDAVGNCGSSFSPSANPLPDPKQCRLHPLSNNELIELVHQLEKKRDKLSEELVAIKRKLAELIG